MQTFLNKTQLITKVLLSFLFTEYRNEQQRRKEVMDEPCAHAQKEACASGNTFALSEKGREFDGGAN